MCFYKTIIKYKTERIYIWQESEKQDCFFVNNNKIICFNKISDYEAFVSRYHLNVIDEGNKMLIIPKRELFELKGKNLLCFCNEMLNVWNLAIDIKNSFTNTHTMLDGNKKLYDKLFYGCNLIQDTENESVYIPLFSNIEHRQINAIINNAYNWIDDKLEKNE